MAVEAGARCVAPRPVRNPYRPSANSGQVVVSVWISAVLMSCSCSLDKVLTYIQQRLARHRYSRSRQGSGGCRVSNALRRVDRTQRWVSSRPRRGVCRRPLLVRRTARPGSLPQASSPSAASDEQRHHDVPAAKSADGAHDRTLRGSTIAPSDRIDGHPEPDEDPLQLVPGEPQGHREHERGRRPRGRTAAVRSLPISR